MKKKTKAHKITPRELKDALDKACDAIDAFCLTYQPSKEPNRVMVDLMDELMIVYMHRLEDKLGKLNAFAIQAVEKYLANDN